MGNTKRTPKGKEWGREDMLRAGLGKGPGSRRLAEQGVKESPTQGKTVGLGAVWAALPLPLLCHVVVVLAHVLASSPLLVLVLGPCRCLVSDSSVTVTVPLNMRCPSPSPPQVCNEVSKST